MEAIANQDTQVEQEEAPRQDFRITDPGELDWAMARLAALRKEKADNDAAAAQAIARIEARREKLNATVARGMAFFESHIAAYCHENRKGLLGGGKKKSRTFLHGVVRWRQSSEAPKVISKDALLVWAQQQPLELGFLRIKEEPAWDAIKEHCKKTGEVPPGVEIEPASEKFEIETEDLKDGNDSGNA